MQTSPTTKKLTIKRIMRKIKILALAFLLGTGAVMANPVELGTAQKVAKNFYAAKYSTTANLALAYTERDANGQPVFYVFNVNTDKGFVIITAEDAAMPIIGYSNEGPFVIPSATNGGNVFFWLQRRKSEVIAMRAHNATATADISDEWATYISNTNAPRTHSVAVVKDSCLPLLKTVWDQSPYYNAYCPGGSVTGCVATAMAQIMKYWSYPAVGIGSSCYYDQKNYGYSENYGQLCAYYDTSHYVWSAMTDNLGKPNNQIAKLMYDCGVSVDMDYTPTGSGASVMGFGPSAFNSFTQYFGYDASLINTASYNPSQVASWITLLENDLNLKRPLDFQGTDPNNGGHSWVCDGYSSKNEMHMNWGWSGANDGYFAVTSLNPGGFDFSQQIAVIYGITPPPGALAVQQITDKTNVNVYPNPSHGVFTFDLTNSTGNFQVRIYNVLGEEVSTSIINSGKAEINLSSQSKGVYIYRLLTEKGESVSTGRLVVE